MRKKTNSSLFFFVNKQIRHLSNHNKIRFIHKQTIDNIPTMIPPFNLKREQNYACRELNYLYF